MFWDDYGNGVIKYLRANILSLKKCCFDCLVKELCWLLMSWCVLPKFTSLPYSSGPRNVTIFGDRNIEGWFNSKWIHWLWANLTGVLLWAGYDGLAHQHKSHVARLGHKRKCLFFQTRKGCSNKWIQTATISSQDGHPALDNFLVADLGPDGDVRLSLVPCLYEVNSIRVNKSPVKGSWGRSGFETPISSPTSTLPMQHNPGAVAVTVVPP